VNNNEKKPDTNMMGRLYCKGTRTGVARKESCPGLEVFLYDATTQSFTISVIPFQNPESLNLEQPRRYCISAPTYDGRLVFCPYFDWQDRVNPTLLLA